MGGKCSAGARSEKRPIRRKLCIANSFDSFHPEKSILVIAKFNRLVDLSKFSSCKFPLLKFKPVGAIELLIGGSQNLESTQF
jgi:hypothetical protein